MSQIPSGAFLKTFRDPDFHREVKKLADFEAWPLMPEERDKAIRELSAMVQGLDILADQKSQQRRPGL